MPYNYVLNNIRINIPPQAGDLRGISLYQSLDTEGLHTLGTVIVDYRGYRVVGQSIISGILS